jgi:hypothetical protein
MNIVKDISQEIQNIENLPGKLEEDVEQDIWTLIPTGSKVNKNHSKQHKLGPYQPKTKFHIYESTMPKSKANKALAKAVKQLNKSKNKSKGKNKRKQPKGRMPNQLGFSSIREAPTAISGNFGFKQPKFYYSNKNSRVGMRGVGTEVIANAATLSTNATGDVLVTIPIMPALLANTNLQVISQLFEFYKFTRMRVCYVPSCPTTSSGQLLGFFDDDPSSIQRLVPNGSGDITNVRIANNHEGSGRNVVWDVGCYNYSRQNRNPQFYTDPNYVDPRTSIEATFVLVQGATADTASHVYGELYLDYDVEFWGKEFNQDTTGTGNYFYSAGTSPFTLNGSGQAVGFFPSTLAGQLAQMSNLPYSLGSVGTSGFTNNAIILPPGQYLVQILSQGWSALLTGASITGFNGVTATATELRDTLLGTTSIAIAQAVVNVPAGLTVVAGFGFVPTYTSAPSPTAFAMYILSLPGSVVPAQWDLSSCLHALRLGPQTYDPMLPKSLLIKDKSESSTEKMAKKLAFMLNDGND